VSDGTLRMLMDDAAGGRRGTRAVVSDALLRAVDDAYGIRPDRPPADLGGSSNLNLLIRDERGPWVVRVYRPHVTDERLAAIHAVRRRLAAAGIPCGGLRETRDGADSLAVGDRLLEVERFVGHDGRMNSWKNLQVGIPLLARIHGELRDFMPSDAAGDAPFANYLSAADALSATQRGTQRMRNWGPSANELELAERAEQLAYELAAIESALNNPSSVQLVHGDYWDNNVFMRGGKVVHVADFDFMGARPRTDDLALTLYFACMQYREHETVDEMIRRVAGLVFAYCAASELPLTEGECVALPAAMARQPLWSIGGWIALLDDEQSARQHAAGCQEEVKWASGVVRELGRWQAACINALR
jgi:Ser/Thr protein kinase RdoA (MazF antagonist)